MLPALADEDIRLHQRPSPRYRYAYDKPSPQYRYAYDMTLIAGEVLERTLPRFGRPCYTIIIVFPKAEPVGLSACSDKPDIVDGLILARAPITSIQHSSYIYPDSFIPVASSISLTVVPEELQPG